MCDGKLMEGDLLLKVGGHPVTRPQQVESITARISPDAGGVVWQVLRSRQQVEICVHPSALPSDGTERLIVFNGLVLRPTLRAVAERGGPMLPHAQPGQGLYFWYIFPGSPADTFGVLGPGWLVQINDEKTPSIDHLLDVIHSGVLKGCQWLRCRIMDSEGRPTVRAIQPDALFWPTVEFARQHIIADNHCKSRRWIRIEHET